MALLHSRIRRVFYHYLNPCGALGSKYKLHVQQGFNHHFEVYQGTNTIVAADNLQSED
jgi:tRNA-specific adenosine deaminase 3